MPPRTQASSAAKKPAAGSSSLKALDDFLEKSNQNTRQSILCNSLCLQNAAPGEVLGTEAQASLEAHSKAIREKYFEQYSVQAIQQNMQQLDKCRTQTLIFGGITAGVFGFDGLQGMLFYLFLVAFVSVVIAMRLGFNPKPYFVNLSQACTSGMFGNVLTYLLMWVMFHNLVYVL